jgi:hypothetical protein
MQDLFSSCFGHDTLNWNSTMYQLQIDETLPIIKKSKHPKNREYKEQNGRIYA